MADNLVKIKASLENKVSGPLNDIRKAMDKSLGKGSSASFFGNVGAKAVTKGFDLIGSAASGVMDTIGSWNAAASALNEETSKSGVIFGENAEEIQAWAETMDTAAGQSERAALEAASGFAGMFATVGTGIDESTERAKKLTELGSDLASFFNTDVQTALDALKSGLAGESEPLRRFNVFLSETAVSAKLAEMGIKKVGGTFTEGQKAAARYAIILEQTGSAQGDFARTSDGAANSQRILNAEIENMNAELGERSLPLQMKWIQLQRDAIPVALEGATALDNMATGLGFLASSAFDATNEWNPFINEADRADTQMRHMTGGSMRDLANTFPDIGTGASNAAAKVKQSMTDMESSVTNALSGIESATKALADAFYDPITAKADLAEVELEIVRQRNLRNAAKAGSEERTEAQNNLNELNKKKLLLLGELSSYGDKAATQALQTEIDILKSVKNLTTGQVAELAKLEAALRRAKLAAFLLNSALRDDTRNTGHGRASGGPVPPGTYTVGEEGPETLITYPGGGGYVIPRARRSSGGGGGMPITQVIQLVVSGKVLAEVVRTEEHWATPG